MKNLIGLLLALPVVVFANTNNYIHITNNLNIPVQVSDGGSKCMNQIVTNHLLDAGATETIYLEALNYSNKFCIYSNSQQLINLSVDNKLITSFEWLIGGLHQVQVPSPANWSRIEYDYSHTALAYEDTSGGIQFDYTTTAPDRNNNAIGHTNIIINNNKNWSNKPTTGSWINSCDSSTAKYMGGILFASCKDNEGNLRETSTITNIFSQCSNKNGNLICQNSTPTGSWTEACYGSAYDSYNGKTSLNAYCSNGNTKKPNYIFTAAPATSQSQCENIYGKLECN